MPEDGKQTGGGGGRGVVVVVGGGGGGVVVVGGGVVVLGGGVFCWWFCYVMFTFKFVLHAKIHFNLTWLLQNSAAGSGVCLWLMPCPLESKIQRNFWKKKCFQMLVIFESMKPWAKKSFSMLS